ncbi:hypothetical protein [Endozoicomonas sp.]|uniref:hypothetical protein n=1 Tax=Endozoicomonas sp. TaxID=1892382 RepID=UPI00383AC240
MKYNQSTYFTRIGAPYTNIRNSWGGESKTKIVLKGWADEAVREGEHQAVMIDWDSNGADKRIGYYERKRHVDSIQDGKPAFIILSSNKVSEHVKFGNIDTNTPLLCIDRLEQRGNETWAICQLADRTSFKVVKMI